jgi:hypothetical protein
MKHQFVPSSFCSSSSETEKRRALTFAFESLLTRNLAQDFVLRLILASPGQDDSLV